MEIEVEDVTPDPEEQMTVGVDCCPHYVSYGSDCDQCDEEEEERQFAYAGRKFKRVDSDARKKTDDTRRTKPTD